MSFREVRTLCEVLRRFGYPGLISENDFKTPNFPLASEILYWLCQALDPTVVISSDIATEQQRVQFVKTTLNVLLSQTGIRLTGRNIYSADSKFVKELLKLLVPLSKPVNIVDTESSQDLNIDQLLSLVPKIIESGGAVYDILQKELAARRDREKAFDLIERLGDVEEIRLLEKQIDSLVASEYQEIVALKRSTEELKAEAVSLQSQIKKRQIELERTQKRLTNMKQVKPAFLEEYHKLETDLHAVYESYVDRFRNLTYLESSLASIQQEEQKEMIEREKMIDQINKRLREEELRKLRSETSLTPEIRPQILTQNDDDQF